MTLHEVHQAVPVPAEADIVDVTEILVRVTSRTVDVCRLVGATITNALRGDHIDVTFDESPLGGPPFDLALGTLNRLRILHEGWFVVLSNGIPNPCVYDVHGRLVVLFDRANLRTMTEYPQYLKGKPPRSVVVRAERLDLPYPDPRIVVQVLPNIDLPPGSAKVWE